MSLADTYFIDAVNTIINNGFSDENYKVRPVWPSDGTPAHTIKTFCYICRYDLSKEFPVLTLRKQFFKNAVRELLWMWQKKSNNINDLGLHIWDSWADENGSIGATYGYQLGKKAKYSEGVADQVDHLIYTLKNNPMDRRMITTMWCPEDLHKMNLAPCVYETLWDVSDNKLNLTLMQRSGDLLAAAAPGSWDCIQYAVLQTMLAQVCGYKPGEFVHIVNNLHIYDRHLPIVKEIIKRPTFEAPKLWINPEITDFYDFTIDDVKLVDYNSNPSDFKFEVAV